MFKIKTATGKEFNSSFAVESPMKDGAYIKIVGDNHVKIKQIFSNPAELPIAGYPLYHTIIEMVDMDNGVKLVLKP